MRKNYFTNILHFLLPGLCFFSIICLWELTCHFFKNLLFILPSPSEIIVNLFNNWPRFSYHLFITLKEMLLGMALAFFIAFPTAWLMNESKTARLTIQPIFVISQSIPMFAIAPIMVMWFGWSIIAIIIPTALMVFFPLCLTLYQGLNATPKEMLEFFYLHKASKWQTFTKLSLPYAIPHIFSGIKISAAVAAIAAVSAEWTGAQAGLGMLIQESRRDTDLQTTFGAIFLTVILSFTLFTITIMIERFLKKPRKISSFLKTILLFGLIGLLGCSDLKKENNQTTLLLDWFANPNHVPIYAGISKGFFQEENISLNIKKIFDPSDSIPYLTSNQTDLAIYYMPQTIRAQSKGANLKVIGSLIDKPLNCILYRKDSSINTIEDLEGKTIGYAMASLNTLQLQKLCIEKKITPKETICLSTDLVAAISTGRVDATLGCYKNIESQQLLAMGVETGSFPIQILGIPEFEELVILANSIKGQDKNFITRFKRAMQKSIDFCKNNPQEAFELYTHQNPDKMQNTISWEEKAWQLTYPLFSISQDFNKNKWQDFSNWMFNNGLIINNVSAETLNPL